MSADQVTLFVAYPVRELVEAAGVGQAVIEEIQVVEFQARETPNKYILDDPSDEVAAIFRYRQHLPKDHPRIGKNPREAMDKLIIAQDEIIVVGSRKIEALEREIIEAMKVKRAAITVIMMEDMRGEK